MIDTLTATYILLYHMNIFKREYILILLRNLYRKNGHVIITGTLLIITQ